MMNLGIDKIALTSTEFRAKDLSKFTISCLKKPDEEVPFLINDSQGNDYFGNKAFIQTDNSIIDINNRGLLIAFNPSKILHPYKLNSNLKEITETIKKEVSKSGIDTDINNMRVSRLDLTKQAEMKQPIHTYNDVFGYLRGKRLTSKQYPSGFNFGNKSNEVVFYDKRAEMVYKHKMNLAEKNFMRAEVKFKKSKNVCSETSLTNYRNLLDAPLDQLKTSYDNYLNNRVFNNMHLGEQLTLDFYAEADILKSYISQHPRGGINKYLMDLGLDTALEMFSGLEGFKMLLEAIDVPQRTIYRTIANLNKQYQRKAVLDSKRGLDTVASRLKEVQETFSLVA